MENNEVLRALAARKSVRVFTGEPITAAQRSEQFSSMVQTKQWASPIRRIACPVTMP